MSLKNKVQLITYPDSLGGDLISLNNILQKYFKDVFEGGIHILPPFPSSGDRGFAPMTYMEIDPSFGTWEDIRSIGQNFDLMLDLMVNHISKQSIWFQDFLKKGRNSEFADLFLTLDKIWGDGIAKQEDVDNMFLRRTIPYSSFLIEETRKEETVWTTFGKHYPSEQIDLDISSDATKKLLTSFMVNFSTNNIKTIRLDAVGYVIKKPGTSCFFVEPEIYRFLSWIGELAKSLAIELLPEVHSHHSIQYKLAERGYWIYDFVLPFLILETLINQSSLRLLEYLKNRPDRQVTMLDCHDGIPVKPDLDGLVSSRDTQKIIDICLQRGSNLSRVFPDKHKGEDGFDVHQIRCSYYSVLDRNDDAYLAARAIQFFTPGIPQVYYVGLLAGQNDIERVNRTGEGREINRHIFTTGEIDCAVQKTVTRRLIKLIRFRNRYAAFDGIFKVVQTVKNRIIMEWEKNEYKCQLYIELETCQTIISYSDGNGTMKKYNV